MSKDCIVKMRYLWVVFDETTTGLDVLHSIGSTFLMSLVCGVVGHPDPSPFLGFAKSRTTRFHVRNAQSFLFSLYYTIFLNL